MKKELISHFPTYTITSLIVFFIAFQFFCLILIQPHTTYAQSRACEYITPIGVKRFTIQEQKRHRLNSGQNLLCYARVQDCQSITPGSDVIPRTQSTVMCDVGPCTFHGECMCPTDPMECLRDDIDGRNRYRNGQNMVRIDDDTSCQSTGPVRAKVFTREEQRRHRFNSGDRYLCYSNVQICHVNNIPIDTDIIICDAAEHRCPRGWGGGVTCSCPTNLNECAKDTIDGNNIYLGSTKRVQADEQPPSPSRQRRPRSGRGL